MAADDVVTGIEGKVSLDATVFEVTAFTIAKTGAVIDTTDGSHAAAGYRNKLPGKFKQWSGTMELFLKIGEVVPDPNVSLAFIGTEEVTLGTVTHTGNISITEVTDTIPVEAEEAVKVSVTYEGLSVLTSVNTTP